MKNTLNDLNNYLFEQIERLNDDGLDAEALDHEIKRARTISTVSSAIVANGMLALRAQAVDEEYGNTGRTKFNLLEGE